MVEDGNGAATLLETGKMESEIIIDTKIVTFLFEVG